MIDVWINEGSGWIVESIESQYINISTYWPLSGSSYISLHKQLKNPRKALINIKQRSKISHVRHPERITKIDKKLVKHITNPEKITEKDKELISDLDYDEIEFPMQEKDFSKIEVKNNICINVFGYENELVFPIYVSDQKCEDSIDLLLLIDDDRSHYVHIKDFCKSCLQFFSSKNVLTEHKEDCLIINGKQSVKLEKGTIEFDLKEYKYCKKVMKKHFNKNLIISEEEEHLFQQSNSCWICKKLIDNDEEKVRDHCHVTGKFRGAAHWNCNINFQLTKKVPVIFHNLRGYDSHLTFNELDKFDVKISVIPNGLEKYMTFFWIKT